MGHRSSKSAIANSSTSADLYINHNTTTTFNNYSTQTAQTSTTATTTPRRPTELWNSNSSNNNNQSNTNTNSSNRIPIPLPGTTINVQIDENPTTIEVLNNHRLSESATAGCSNSLQNRQIIIKIQLAKMENGNETLMGTNTNTAATTSAASTSLQQEVAEASAVNATTTLDTNHLESMAASSSSNNTSNNSCSGNTQFVNLTLNGNFIYPDEGSSIVNNSEIASSSSSSSSSSIFTSNRTAGGSIILNNNKNNFNNSTTLEHNSTRDLQIRLNTLHIQEDWEHQQHRQQSNDSLPEYCEVLEESSGNIETTTAKDTKESRRSETSLTDTMGCLSGRRKSKSSSRPSSTSSLSAVMLSRRRCRDAIRRILEPTSKSSSSSNKNKEQHNKKHSEYVTPPPLPARPASTLSVLPSTSGLSEMRSQNLYQNQKNLTASSSTSNATNNLMPISITAVNNNGASGGGGGATTMTTSTATATTTANLIIPITSPPQFVVVQCAPSSVVTLDRIDNNAIRLTSTDVATVNGFNVSNNNNNNNSNISSTFAATTNLTRSMSNGPIVHSQVDFVHCLVPDLDKIVNSSFYWGKIDRYEAERLLEGKSEGTFLLRDSAQEEYLFSVTFRKYGRSLHARIEQSGHKFGFDCHDPGVFTAPTVTGLLQHYKDPACVMFFEPMLTIPLHRKTVFSLQEMARAVIVSNTTYDGINELGLPVRVKSFLKEYHYKQKLRVKPCDEPFYSCT